MSSEHLNLLEKITCQNRDYAPYNAIPKAPLLHTLFRKLQMRLLFVLTPQRRLPDIVSSVGGGYNLASARILVSSNISLTHTLVIARIQKVPCSRAPRTLFWSRGEISADKTHRRNVNSVLSLKTDIQEWPSVREL